jgi:TPR repeat protein
VEYQVRIQWLFILGLMCFSAHAGIGDFDEELAASDSWLFRENICPADVMPGNSVDVSYLEGLCGKDVVGCLAKCKRDSVLHCYNLAQYFESLETDKYDKYADALFLKSCELGSASGCTNIAAAMQNKLGDEALSCALRVYEGSCGWGDPWGCTMLGFHLAHGEGIEQDLDRALKVLSKSCKYGITDPACANARALIEKINEAGSERPVNENE